MTTGNFSLHSVKVHRSDDCRMAAFHIILRNFALVDLLLFGEEIYSELLLVTPAGFEPAVSGLRGRRPEPIRRRRHMEMRVGFEPTNNSVADCPLEPLEYRIMVGAAGFEPAISAYETGALTT